MANVDTEAFAGEITCLAPARRPRPWLGRLGATISIGTKAGAVPAAVVFAVYFSANHRLELPWVRLASILAVYGPAVGILLALASDLLIAAFDRVAAIGHGLRWIANPVTAGALGGGLAGIAPGIVGVLVFGSYSAPFAGTALIAGAFIIGAVMVAAPLSRRGRSARSPRAGRTMLAAVAIATLVLCAATAIVMPIVTATAFDHLRGELAANGGVVGAIAGAIGCGLLGGYIGLVVAVSRWLARPGDLARTIRG